jgi:hypothetical protein
MSARNELMALYQEWRTLSEAEGEAIQSAIWPQVNRCQSAKSQLQTRILAAHELFQAELAAHGLDAREHEAQYRKTIAELILLEQRNGEFLDAQRQRAAAQIRELGRTRQNLRHVHRAYAGPREAAWNSYS